MDVITVLGRPIWWSLLMPIKTMAAPLNTKRLPEFLWRMRIICKLTMIVFKLRISTPTKKSSLVIRQIWSWTTLKADNKRANSRGFPWTLMWGKTLETSILTLDVRVRYYRRSLRANITMVLQQLRPKAIQEVRLTLIEVRMWCSQNQRDLKVRKIT